KDGRGARAGPRARCYYRQKAPKPPFRQTWTGLRLNNCIKIRQNRLPLGQAVWTAYIVVMVVEGSLKLQAADMHDDNELSILMGIGQLLSSTLELREAFGKIMQIISDKLQMHRGALVLLDESSGRLRTEAAVGLTPEEIERGKYAVGEGITGNVVATGRARIIPDVRSEPDFLNRTGRLSAERASRAVSFLCVPIKIEGRTAGALSVDKPFESDGQLTSDQSILEIIAAF